MNKEYKKAIERWMSWAPFNKKKTQCKHCKGTYYLHCKDEQDPKGCYNYIKSLENVIQPTKEEKTKKQKERKFGSKPIKRGKSY